MRAGIHPYGQTTLGRQPLGRHPPPADIPRQTPPLPDGHCSGRYASYWNAFLFESVSRLNWIQWQRIFVNNIVWTCNFMLKRSKCFHITNKTQERDWIHKWTPIHASVIYQISWIHWIFISIRENSNGPRNSVQKTVQNVCDWIHKQPKASVQSMHFFCWGKK